MSKRPYRPNFDPITQVPIIPVHKDLGGRDAEDQHPIEAITGLQDALDAKVGAEAGKQLSTEDYTTAEKTKLAGIEEFAEANAIGRIVVNGEEVQPDGGRAVSLDIPTASEYAVAVSVDASTGVLSVLAADGSTISAAATPVGTIITAASWDSDNYRLVLTKADGSTFTVPIRPYMLPVTGDGVDTQTTATEDGIVVSLTSGTKAVLDGAVLVTGAQTVGGNKTFTGNVVNEGSVGAQWMRTTKAASDTGQYSTVTTQVSTEGSPATVAYDDVYNNGSRMMYRRHLYSADRSHNSSLTLSVYNDGTSAASAPSYVAADSGGNVQPTPSGTVVTGGMLAVDPQVVHTFGTETVAGSKTFTGSVVNQGAVGQQVLKSTKSWEDTGEYSIISTQINASGENAVIAYDDVYSQSNRTLYRRRTFTPDHSSSASLILVQGLDGNSRVTAPSYIITDEGGTVQATPGTTVVTGGMLAVDPQVVHTYGAEEIAGDKTLSGAVTASASLTASGTLDAQGLDKSKDVLTPYPQEAGAWYKVYDLPSNPLATTTLVLWSSTTTPVMDTDGAAGILMVSVIQARCVLRWMCGMEDAAEADLQNTALVDEATTTAGGSTTHHWSLWQRCTYASAGRYLHRIAEYNKNGASSQWTALSPTAEDAAESLPSGEGITVHYSEA